MFSFLERISDGKEENKTITFSLLFQLKHRNSIFLKGRGGFVVLAESFFIYYCFPLTFFFFNQKKEPHPGVKNTKASSSVLALALAAGGTTRAAEKGQGHALSEGDAGDPGGTSTPVAPAALGRDDSSTAAKLLLQQNYLGLN